MEGRKIVVGMSGGVDSSMALLLLKRKGWKPVGVSLKLPSWQGAASCMRENACCTAESLRIARDVCRKLGVPYHTMDARREFEREVMDYFVSELREGRTPNPCVVCNRHLKFRNLFEWARRHGIKYVATGHYARVKVDAKDGKAHLLQAKDLKKDQSYGLCMLSQGMLKHIVFPLGAYMKDDVYQLAEKEGFELFRKRKQSQDLCFVSGKDLPRYVEEELGRKEGAIVDSKGNVLGRHRGLHFHTIGQRRGLCLNGAYYVKELDAKRDELVVTAERDELLKREVLLSPFNFISGKAPVRKIAVLANVRYHQPLQKAVLFPPEKGSVRVFFRMPIEPIAPGQVCAAYKGSECIGGGFILEAK